MNGCCRPCQENFQNELSFIQLPAKVEKLAQQRYNRWASYQNLRPLHYSKTKRSQNIHVKTTESEHVPSLAFIETHLLHKATEKSNPSNIATGEEVQQMMPCCPVCSEEFYAPSDFDDLSAFWSSKQHQIRHLLKHRKIEMGVKSLWQALMEVKQPSLIVKTSIFLNHT